MQLYKYNKTFSNKKVNDLDKFKIIKIFLTYGNLM